MEEPEDKIRSRQMVCCGRQYILRHKNTQILYNPILAKLNLFRYWIRKRLENTFWVKYKKEIYDVIAGLGIAIFIILLVGVMAIAFSTLDKYWKAIELCKNETCPQYHHCSHLSGKTERFLCLKEYFSYSDYYEKAYQEVYGFTQFIIYFLFRIALFLLICSVFITGVALFLDLCSEAIKKVKEENQIQIEEV